MSKDDNSREQILEVRMQHLRQDLDMIEAKKERLESDRNSLILKLIAQREQLLALKEQALGPRRPARVRSPQAVCRPPRSKGWGYRGRP